MRVADRGQGDTGVQRPDGSREGHLTWLTLGGRCRPGTISSAFAGLGPYQAVATVAAETDGGVHQVLHAFLVPV